MSSVNLPFGLNPIRHINGKFVPAPRAIPGGIASGQSGDIFYGSPVTMNTSGTIQISTTAQDIYGVFAGCQYIANATSLLTPVMQWPSGTSYLAGSMIAYVWEDPGIIYEIQANGSLPQTAVGDQADFASIGTGVLGRSTATISTTLAGSGVQAQLSIQGLSYRAVDNAWGDAFTVVEVKIARQQFTANKLAF
jgi:hypothetical protein